MQGVTSGRNSLRHHCSKTTQTTHDFNRRLSARAGSPHAMSSTTFPVSLRCGSRDRTRNPDLRLPEATRNVSAAREGQPYQAARCESISCNSPLLPGSGCPHGRNDRPTSTGRSRGFRAMTPDVLSPAGHTRLAAPRAHRTQRPSPVDRFLIREVLKSS